jgi:hypothetical protein
MTCLLSWLAMQIPLGLGVAFVLFKAGRRGAPRDVEADRHQAQVEVVAVSVVNADAA